MGEIFQGGISVILGQHTRLRSSEERRGRITELSEEVRINYQHRHVERGLLAVQSTAGLRSASLAPLAPEETAGTPLLSPGQ